MQYNSMGKDLPVPDRLTAPISELLDDATRNRLQELMEQLEANSQLEKLNNNPDGITDLGASTNHMAKKRRPMIYSTDRDISNHLMTPISEMVDEGTRNRLQELMEQLESNSGYDEEVTTPSRLELPHTNNTEIDSENPDTEVSLEEIGEESPEKTAEVSLEEAAAVSRGILGVQEGAKEFLPPGGGVRIIRSIEDAAIATNTPEKTKNHIKRTYELLQAIADEWGFGSVVVGSEAVDLERSDKVIISTGYMAAILKDENGEVVAFVAESNEPDNAIYIWRKDASDEGNWYKVITAKKGDAREEYQVRALPHLPIDDSNSDHVAKQRVSENVERVVDELTKPAEEFEDDYLRRTT